MKAVIPAAGKGRRFNPWTLSNAKELVPVPDPKNPARIVSVIDLVIREACEAGCDDIRLITALGKLSLEQHIQTQKMNKEMPGVEISYSHQDGPKGLGHAVYCAKRFASQENFAVLLGDDFYKNNPTKELIAAYEQKDRGKFGAILTVQEFPKEELGRYGVVKVKNLDKIMEISDIIEKPKKNPPSNYAVTGRYVFSYRIFDYIKKVRPDANGEIQLTNAIRLMIRDGYRVYALQNSGTRYDAGEPVSWMKVIETLQNHKNI